MHNIKMQRAGDEALDKFLGLLPAADLERSKDRETRARMLTAGLVVLNFSYWRSTPRKL